MRDEGVPAVGSWLSWRRAWLAAGAGVVGLLAFLLPAVAQAADPAPLRTVSDPNPNFSGVWVDTVNNELIVGDDNHHAAFVYSRTATGAAAPLRTIKGLSTLLDYPSSLVVDTTNNELWAVNDDTSDRAVVYSRTANGAVAPLRVVDFKALELTEKRTWGWSVDPLNDEVAGTFQNGSTVDFFGRASGDPLRSISGPATGLADPHGIFIDTTVNEIYVVNSGEAAPSNALGTRDGTNGAPSITVYARTASGNVAPKRTIQGNLTQLDHARPLFVDSGRHEIVVADGSPTDAILFFDQNANGDVAPVRVLQGAQTGLSNPTGVFVDIVNNELLVANWGNHTITVYPRGAGGNIKPTRVISPTKSRVAAGIGNPGAIYVDPERDEIGVVN